MKCGRAANFSWKAKLLQGLLGRENTLLLWKRKPVHTSSNIYLPLFPPSATNRHKAAASPLFFLSSLSHSSCHGKEETLSFGITERSVARPAVKLSPSLDSLCVLVLAYTLGFQGKGQTNAVIP